MTTSDYPSWTYYPNSTRPPGWARELVMAVANVRQVIDSTQVLGLTSNAVLAKLQPGLKNLGYRVEVDKKAGSRIRRPVLFGEGGKERVAYEVDAAHDELGIVVEIEAGRGARGNALYRDLVRASLIVDARFLVLGMMKEYRHQSGAREVTVQSYRDAKDVLDAVFASGRLRLPFEGVLLFGY